MFDISQLIAILAQEPNNDRANLDLAKAYHDLGQTAAAVTFYTRAAELTVNKNLAYSCLIRTAQCFDTQGNRHVSVKSMLRRAIVLLPQRPEAYWYLAKFHEYHNQTSECVMLCDLAQEICDFSLDPLEVDVGYPGAWALRLERAIAGWWWGMNDQTRAILQELFDQHWHDMPVIYRKNLVDNMTKANMMTDYWSREFDRACDTVSDINQHLPYMRSLAQQCQHITEMGVRWGVSTRAWLHSDAVLRSYDISVNPDIRKLFDVAQMLGKDAVIHETDVLTVHIDETQLLFIDTLHTYGQLRAELERHGNRSTKYLVFHDTHTFGHRDEQGSGPGLQLAISEWLARNPHWQLIHETQNNNGLMVLERKSQG